MVLVSVAPRARRERGRLELLFKEETRDPPTSRPEEFSFLCKDRLMYLKLSLVLGIPIKLCSCTKSSLSKDGIQLGAPGWCSHV